MTSIVISSGHSTKCQGAVGVINEVAEATRVVDKVAQVLKDLGATVHVFHDTKSTSQDANLKAIVNYHNSKKRDLDVSVHFNAYQPTTKPMGTECLYVTQKTLADDISAAMANAGGFLDRGPKKRTDLYFLNNTAMPAVLLEVCFVDSQADVDLYSERFTEICKAIAHTLVGDEVPIPEPGPEPGPEDVVSGKCSHFGGPEDSGVSASEGLAFIYKVEDAPQLFLPSQPPGTTGLARRLNPYVHYLAMRWDYSSHPKNTLVHKLAFVRNPRTGFGLAAIPADWGPHESTGRIADLSPSLMQALDLKTDDVVEVIFPYEGEMLA